MKTLRFPTASLLALSIAACAPAPLLVPPSPAPVLPTGGGHIRGSAWLDQDLAGATVSLLDTSGKVLREYPNATGTQGTFLLEPPANLPQRFRLVVAGGSLGNTANDQKLVADFEGFTPDTRVAIVNGLTTLASKYIDLKPGTTPAAAEAAVESYLALPTDGNLGFESAPGVAGAFDATAYAAAARSEGGLEAFSAKLAAELGSGKTRTFTSTNKDGAAAAGAFLGLTGKQVFTEFAKGAGTELLKVGLGWVAAQLGYKDEATRRAEEIQAALAENTKKMEQIKADLADVSKDLDKVKKEILIQIDEGNYTSQAQVMATRLAGIDTAYDNMIQYVRMGIDRDKQTNELKYSRAQMYDLMATWRNTVKFELEPRLESIHLGLVSNQVRRGLLEMWGVNVANKTQTGKKLPNLVDNTYLIPLNEMYDYYFGYQFKILLMAIEAYHMEQMVPGKVVDNLAVQQLLSAFEANMAAQSAARGYRVMSDQVNKECLYDRGSKVMWKREAIAFWDANHNLVDVSVFDPYVGAFTQGPKLILNEFSFNGVLNLSPGNVGANAFKGWRTPTMEEFQRLQRPGVPYLDPNELIASGMSLREDSNWFATSTYRNDPGAEAIIFFNTSSGQPTGIPLYKPDHRQLYRQVRMVPCRTITDFNEPQSY